MRRSILALFAMLPFMVTGRSVAGEIFILNERGAISILNNKGGIRELVGDDFPLGRRTAITEAIIDYCTTATIYVTAPFDIYEIHPLVTNPKYEKMKGGEGAHFLFKELSDARLTFMTHIGDPSKRKFVTKKKEATVFEERSNRPFLIFSHRHIDSKLIPNGEMTTKELSSTRPESRDVLASYPDDSWVMIGQSENLTEYGRVFPRRLQLGEEYSNQILIHDRMTNHWKIFTINESVTGYVYNSICILKGKKHKRTESGKYIDEETGNFYIYLLGSGRLIPVHLDPALEVQYADHEQVYLSKGKEIYILPYTTKGIGALAKFGTAPIVPYYIFPTTKGSE